MAVIGITVMLSCNSNQKYPDEPQIEFVSYSFRDTLDILGNPNVHLGLLTISFTDGDGDIGLYQSETELTDVFIYRIGILNGSPSLSDMDTLNFRIPYLTPEAQNKTLRGEIDVEFNLYKANYPYDTMYYELYIQDRALNTSNIITTPEIVL